ncbi:MAG: phosphoribosyltransferase family protein [Acidiferrobacterales bacterium]
MMTLLRERLRSIPEWLLPGTCLLCVARIPSGDDFCGECEASLPFVDTGCPQCAALVTLDGPDAYRCGQCQQRPPVFSRTVALFRYATPIDRLIHDLKYRGRLETARILGRRFAAFLEARASGKIDLIVPVPLHRTRLRERGFNQSLELARPVAEQLRLPLEYERVQRTRPTAPQTELPQKARWRNVRGAFLVAGGVAGQRIAVIDDVMTTGYTANALAECLRKAGAKDVQVWVLARA